MGVKEAKQALVGLKPDELREVADYAEFLREQATARGSDRHDQILHEALDRHLRALLGESIPPLHVLKRLDIHPRFRILRRSLDAFALTAGVKAIGINERRKMYDTLVGLLVERAQQFDVPLSLKLVLNQAETIAGVFDRAFPGYVQSGMATRILVR